MPAPMPWWELALRVPDPQADDAAALLVDAGALGVQLHTPQTLPLAVGDALPFAASSTVSVLTASFAGDLAEGEPRALARAALAQMGLRLDDEAQLRRRTDTDWAERWKEFFKPACFADKVWVVPSWERDFIVPQGALSITLDPGMAFGTGQHATTALCLELLVGSFASAPPSRLLDVGCGSGILAIASAKLGCQHVVAIDNDPVAVAVAHENVRVNDVELAVQVSGADLTSVTGTFLWVVANIITPVLVELAEPLLAHVAEGGGLLLSGILAEQEDELLRALSQAAANLKKPPLRVEVRRQQGEWLALLLR